MSETSSVHIEARGQLEVRVHPLVLAAVLDHYARRKGTQARVIGALLGTNVEGVVEVTDTFPVPHEESAKDVRLDFDFQSTMRELRRRTSPHEVMVGWYATGTAVTEASVLIHDFYWREIKTEPIHLLVDPASGRLRAFACATFHVAPTERALGSYFRPLRCEFAASEMERVGVATLAHTRDAGGAAVPLAEANSVDSAYDALTTLLDAAIAYVHAVATGEREGDPEVGREIAAIAQTLPVLQPGELERVTTESLQDVLMVAYVANLMRAQLSITERLRSALATAFPVPQQP